MMKENQQLNDKQEKTEEKSDDSKLSSEYNKKLSEFIDIISKQPIISLSCIGIIAILIFYYVSESKVENLANLELDFGQKSLFFHKIESFIQN